VYPESAEDVSTIIKFALKHKIDIAVKGGGSSNRPTSSTEGGICIDLSKFKIVTVEAATKRITVQGGALWSDVYTAIAPHNLAMVGPVINTVGVGGSSLMGGYGWLTGKHGITLDNIVSVEMVLASGEIVHASEHQNEDLFWAVRGAGACFGVVTTFVFQAYTHDHMVWHGNLILPRSALGAAIEVANKVLEKGNEGVAAMGMLWGKAPGQTQPGLVIISYYDGKEEDAKEFFKPLLDQKPFVNTTKMMPWTETIRPEPIVNSEKPPRRFGTGISVIGPFDLSFFESLWNDYADFSAKVEDAKATVTNLVIHNPYVTMSKGQTETSFPNRGRHSNFMIWTAWTEESNDNVCRKWTSGMEEKMRSYREKTIREQSSLDENTRTSVGQYSNDDGELISAVLVGVG
jgi:hypothetical protein